MSANTNYTTMDPNSQQFWNNLFNYIGSWTGRDVTVQPISPLESIVIDSGYPAPSAPVLDHTFQPINMYELTQSLQAFSEKNGELIKDRDFLKSKIKEIQQGEIEYLKTDLRKRSKDFKDTNIVKGCLVVIAVVADFFCFLIDPTLGVCIAFVTLFFSLIAIEDTEKGQKDLVRLRGLIDTKESQAHQINKRLANMVK